MIIIPWEINAKNSEMHAAMGLSVLPYITKPHKKNIKRFFIANIKRLQHSSLELLQADKKSFLYKL
jgi:hypothetical protein